MKVTCDAAKDAENLRKHGVALADAALMNWDNALTWQDARHDYGEPRMIALAAIGERLYCVVFVDRDDERRIISLRKANNREKTYYVSND